MHNTKKHPGDRTIMADMKKQAAVLLRLAGVLSLAVVVASCDTLDKALAVEAPGLIDAGDMSHPQNAGLLVSGAIADFDCALGAYIVNAGLLGNELRDASVTAARFPLDARNIDDTSPYGSSSCEGNPPGIYVPLATAIWTTGNALSKLQGWSDAEVRAPVGTPAAVVPVYSWEKASARLSLRSWGPRSHRSRSSRWPSSGLPRPYRLRRRRTTPTCAPWR
jgi:hypothetical protein